jgi:hypothetical protein
MNANVVRCAVNPHSSVRFTIWREIGIVILS